MRLTDKQELLNDYLREAGKDATRLMLDEIDRASPLGFPRDSVVFGVCGAVMTAALGVVSEILDEEKALDVAAMAVKAMNTARSHGGAQDAKAD